MPALVEAAGDILGGAADLLGDVLGGAADLVGDVLGGAADLVGDVVEGAVDIVEDVVGVVGDAVEWVVDEVIEPVVSTVGDVVEYALDNPIEAIAIAASVVVPGLSPWVVPLASGAQTLANGGDLGDAIKSATLSYAGQYVGDVAKTYVAPSISSTVGKTVTNPELASTVAKALTEGVEAGAKTFVSSEGDLSAAARSFATAGTLSGVSSGLEHISNKVGLDAAADSVMGNIQDKLEESGFDKSINDLSTGVKDAIYAGVAAELTGQNVSSAMLGAARDDIFSAVGNVDFIDDFIDDSGFIQGVVDKFEPVAKFMDGFVDHVENTAKENLSDAQIKILTDSVTAAWDQAKLGNPDLAGEAFFDKMAEPAYDELYDMITDPVNEALDNLTGNAAKAEAVAETLNTALTNAKNGADGANSTAATIKARFDELDRRKAVYDTAVANGNTSAANAAADAFNTYNDQLKKDLPALEEAYDNYVEQFNKWNPQIEGLQEDYDERSQYLVSDVEDLDAKLKPVFSGAERIAALAIRPQIDEDKYREATGLGEDESVWAHYLANQKEINTVFAQEAVDNFNRAKNDITPDTAPIISSEITRPNTYGPPPMPGMPEVGSLPNVDLTVPKRPGNRGDPRDYGLTKEEIDKYTEASVGKDAWYNFVSGAYEAAAYTVGGFGTFADEVAENIVDSFSVDYSEAEAIAYNNYAIMYDPNLTSAEKKQAIADNTAAYIAARDKALAEEGADIDTFSGYTDPVKNYIMSASERAAGKISPEMQVRQYNALPAEDTTWEQILTGKAKDRLGRPYGLGDPLATVMSGVQELPDLLVDVALLAVTKNPAVLGGTVAVTSMAEAGEAAADEIESNLRTAYKSGALQATPEFADLVRLYKGDEDAALERLIDQGMGYAAVSGVIGGLGDVVLGKIAGASGGSKLLSEVPTGLKTVVKVGTGGIAEGINEASEQVPVNMASINAGLDTSVSTGTGVAFLQGVTSGGTSTAGAASFEAVANTLRMAKDGLLSYTMPDGSTVSPEPPSGADAETLETTSKNLAEYGVRVNLLNDLASWDAIPAQPTALTAQELTDTLNNLNIGDTAEVTNLVNTVYDNSVITLDEARTTFKQTPLTEIPSDSELDKYTGIREAAEFAAEVAAYVDPRFLDIDEVKAAAAAEGVTLTDEQAKEYVGEKDEADAVADIAAEYDPLGTTAEEAEGFYTALGYTPTEDEIARVVGEGNFSDEIREQAVGAYVDPRQVTEDEARKFYEDLGYNPTDVEIAQVVGQGGNNFESEKETGVETYVDPRQVTDAEARKFFSDLGYTPTDEEVADFTAQVAESEQKTAIDKYVDPRFVTQDEVQAIADAEGLTLTEALAATYLGQKDQESTLAAATAEFDPLATTTSEAKAFFEAQGFTPTDQQVANFVASKTEEGQKAAIAEFVDPRQVTTDEAKALFDALGYNPTDAEVADFVGQGEADFATAAETGVATYVDPRQVTDEEARQFFADLGYNDPTDEQVAQFVAQVEETTQKDVISKYVDPRQVTQAEIQAIADEEGLTLTEALAATYLGQSESETFQTEQLAAARAEYDPLATTLEEATQFFADTGYTADTDEIAQFVASKTEEVQTSAIGAYVDPRQMTSDEAREFLSAIGYNPTDQEVADFTGQLNDENYQVTQKAAIDEYVDPRYFDAGEVRAAYEELGLVDVTQEDVDRFVGQFDPEAGGDAEGFESARMDELRTYMPTATFNVIKSIMGSPAVADDPNTEADESKAATGIYAELEAGATRDEALQAAVDKLATDLGTTKDDLLDEIGLSEDRLREEIGAVIDDVTDVKEDVAGVKEDVAGVTEDVGDLADILGTAGVADDPDTEADETQDPTGLFATIKAYEDAGLDRDQALQKAIDDVAGALGTTKDALLDAIGESETTLTGKISDVETGLTETIGDVETNLGADIDAVADLIGKPARDVTQTDIDFVIDLIAQENVSQELITQYDVNADGTVDIADQTLLETALQGDQDVTLADTSMFTPATGLYLQQEQDTQATQDLMTELNTQLNTQINTQTNQQNFAEMQRLLAGAEDAGGQRVDVTSGDKVQLDYLYDISGDSIFATPQQAGLFSSPYGGARGQQPQMQAANQPTGPFRRASGFAEGGQVEDENDRLLRILGEIK